MEKGHYGHYTGNARHSHTPITKTNVHAAERDDCLLYTSDAADE